MRAGAPGRLWPRCLPQDGSWLPGSGRTELFINGGDKGKLRGKALWFLRNVDEGAVVDPSKARWGLG